MKNIKMSPVPRELIRDFDPSLVTYNKSHKTKREALPKMDAARLKSLRIRDFDKALLVLLAAVGMMSNSQMKALLTCVPRQTAPVGFDGLFGNLMDRYGVAFRVRRVFGGLHSRDSAYLKLRSCAKKGLVRTVLQGSTMRIKTELAGGGVEVAWVLTPLGASVLLHLSDRELSLDDIRFWANDTGISLTSQIHDLGVSSFLTALCVGSAHYNNREKPIRVDVAQVVGDGHDFTTNGRKFRPDLSAVVFIQSVYVPLMLEWDTGTTTDKNLCDKATRFMRLLCDAPDGSWSAGRPWLVMACPTETRVKHHETAIRTAARQVGLMHKDYAQDWCGIAVCTHEDLGQMSPFGAIYRVFDYDTGRLSSEKFTLVSLHRRSVPRPVVEAQHGADKTEVRETPPPTRTETKFGASAPLVGHVAEGGGSAAIGWGEEVA